MGFSLCKILDCDFVVWAWIGCSKPLQPLQPGPGSLLVGWDMVGCPWPHGLPLPAVSNAPLSASVMTQVGWLRVVATPTPTPNCAWLWVARGYRRHITRHDASWVRHEPPRPSFAWPSFCFTKNQQVLWKWVAQVRRLFVSMFNRGGHGRIGFRSWPELAGPGPLSAMTKPQSLSRGVGVSLGPRRGRLGRTE